MPYEIERKFLVLPDRLPVLPQGVMIQQGYLLVGDPSVRVRHLFDGSTKKGTITVKSGKGISREEFEYEIPERAAWDILKRCSPKITKLRRRIGRWDVDFFLDLNVWLAEIELASEDESIEIPDWAGEEVTGDPRFLNMNMAK
jgi:CYTH domain-containing protein